MAGNIIHGSSSRSRSASPMLRRRLSSFTDRAAYLVLGIGLTLLLMNWKFSSLLTSTIVVLEDRHNAGSSLAHPSKKKNHNNHGLLHHSTIQKSLLLEAPWAESHGADHDLYLGAGLLYYSFVYAFQSQTVVVLGSGGGFVPRLVRQAQRDLLHAKIPGHYQVILIDAHLASAGFGSTFYAENPETVMRQQFSDIRYIFQTTDEAFLQLQKEGVKIDYLHVDADHTFEQSWKDFENYSSLLSDRAVVSFHDTCHEKKRNCNTGVSKALTKLRESLPQFNLQLIDAHYLYRGIAFAIPAEAPALGPSGKHKQNFCQTNAATLHKSSPGWTMNAKVGTLPSLGDFYQCNTRFDLKALAEPNCPFGLRRDKRGTCNLCIPGMTGENCQEFGYQPLRVKPDHNPTETDQTILRFASAWLATRHSQHMVELGITRDSAHTVASHLLEDQYNLQSLVVIDPKVDQPVWEDGPLLSTRWLPCPIEDVIRGSYTQDVPLRHMDALVCLSCSERIPTGKALYAVLLRELPEARSMVLEDTADARLLAQVAESLPLGWSIETDIALAASGTSNEKRRLMFLTKTTTVPVKTNNRSETTKNKQSLELKKIDLPQKKPKPQPPQVWQPSDFALDGFEVAGVNLAQYQRQDHPTIALLPTDQTPFELFEEFDLTQNCTLTGQETWEDLVRLRRDVQHASLSFYVDKVARRRWLIAHNIPTPKALAAFYRSELTQTGDLEEETTAIWDLLVNRAGNDYVAKSTHLSCSVGVWLVKKSAEGDLFIGHGSKKMEAASKGFQLQHMAESLAKDLHQGPRCGRQQESWALENVQPGVMVEERFASAVDADDDAGGMEFKVITIWGRVWLAQWRPGVSKVQAFVHRNGTTLKWQEGHSEPLPDWIDWARIVALAEEAGAHKDMFRTDIFVGVPAGSLPVEATREERLAAVQYVISETEVHPTPLKGTSEVFQEAGRLWLAGYKLGNYKVVPDSEVPSDFGKDTPVVPMKADSS